MSVPKCKDCEFLKVWEVLTTGFFNSTNLKKSRCCMNEDAEIYNKDEMRKAYPVIESHEYRTSPKWCPLRDKIKLNK